MSFKIYTKSGDKGQTSLFDGSRLPKHHIRIESYGTVDELNAHIGLLRDQADRGDVRAQLLSIQHLLFVVGSQLAAGAKPSPHIPEMPDGAVETLENAIDELTEQLPPLRSFILPGGHVAVSQCHVARTVCRRAERLAVALSEIEPVPPILITYLNRLSDYLFTLCRFLSHHFGAEEIKWEKPV